MGLDELYAEEFHSDLDQLGPETRVVLLAYACSMDRGVMRLEWGEAELQANRYLLWHHHQALSLPGERRSA
ncbi:hypothetical protein ABZX75_00755 [Streptomyces sp. NPDC003038]|uniref:hypothetical protein n=1 Tax=unclassified Streptomyces TaxID=2593676 RepID=UPI0033BEE72B